MGLAWQQDHKMSSKYDILNRRCVTLTGKRDFVLISYRAHYTAPYRVQLCTWSPNELWISNSILNL
jgi:hypothetical protein